LSFVRRRLTWTLTVPSEGGQDVCTSRRVGSQAEAVQEAAGRGRCQYGVAGGHAADGGEQFGGWGVLEEEG